MGTLAEIVKPDFITVAPEDTLGEVAERMSAQNVGAVVVKDFGRLIGILTERDMLRGDGRSRAHERRARAPVDDGEPDHGRRRTCRSTRPRR